MPRHLPNSPKRKRAEVAARPRRRSGPRENPGIS